MAASSRELSAWNMFQRIANSCVFSNRYIIKINSSWLVRVIFDILNNSTKLDSIPNFGFFLSAEIDGFSIASSFNVEDTLVSPDVLIITNQSSLRISTESSLTSTRQAEQESGVSTLAFIGTSMHAECAFLRHVVVHNTEKTFLHLSSVLGSKNTEFFFFEIDSYRCLGSNLLSGGVCIELSSIQNCEVDVRGGKIFLELIKWSSDHHLFHKQSMIRPCSNNSAPEPIVLIPTGVSIDYEKL